MTALLKDVMSERSEAAEFDAPDLDAVMSRGDRRVRTRRAGVAVATVLSLTAIGMSVPMFTRSPGERDADVAATDGESVTWSTGSVIHSTADTVDVGHHIQTFVETNGGYVFAGPDGTVWSWTGSSAEKVGTTSPGNARLVSDGDTVAWTQSGDGYRFFDQVTGEQFTIPVAGNGTEGKSAPGAQLAALDGAIAYAHDGRGLVSLDLVTGESTVLLPDDGNLPSVYDAEAGKVVHDIREDGSVAGVVVSEGFSDEGRRLPVWDGDLSPSATYVMSENADDFTLFEVATGTEIEQSAKQDYDFFTGTSWVDDDTYTALGVDGAVTEPVDLLVCEAATGECEVVAEDAGTAPDLQLPVGERIG